MSIDNLTPISNEHAVQSIAFFLEWNEHLPSKLLLDAQKLNSRFGNLGLPIHKTQQMAVFRFSGQPDLNAVQHDLGGVTFSSLEPTDSNNPREVTLSRQGIVVLIKDYTRWDSVFSEVKNYIKPLLELIGTHRPLSSIGIQVTDVFLWMDDPQELNLREVFKPDGYLPANVFNLKGLWHSHHGFLSEVSAPADAQFLENVNVDRIDHNGQTLIQINGVHKLNLSKPLWQSHLKNIEIIHDAFELLHSANKKMLSALLTDGVQEKISLNNLAE